MFALVRDLDRQARVYAALRSPDDGSWTARGTRQPVAIARCSGVRQPLALLLAAFDRYSDRGQSRDLPACCGR